MLKSLVALATASALLSVAAPALAADLILDAPQVIDNGFNWEGAYVGGFLGGYPTFPAVTAGVELGYDMLVSEQVLLGIEGSALFYLAGGGAPELFLHGRAGVVMDNVAIYGLAGVGTFGPFTGYLWDVGGGIEVALTDNLTFDAELFGRNMVGLLPTVPHIQAGVRYHF
ncbi:MAG: hypothetical protein Q7T08_04885 [Devosia sp.]|nr:hypothetical protein [Devosia sp.]